MDWLTCLLELADRAGIGGASRRAVDWLTCLLELADRLAAVALRSARNATA